MMKTLSIGGATFDLFMKVEENLLHTCQEGTFFALPLGSKKRVSEVKGTFGGGAHNTSVALARLGCAASLSGIIGSDEWGEAIVKNLQKEGVNTTPLVIVENEQTSFSLILNAPSGERSILSHKNMDRHLHDVTFDKELASAVDGVYLNHIHEDTCVIENDIVDILVRTPDTFLSWNPGGCQIDCGLNATENVALLQCTNLLLLNKEEALNFTGTNNVKDALLLLWSKGVKIICITDGQKDSLAWDGQILYTCPTIPCTPVDTTGAGDAFGSAMTWALLSGKDLPTALKAGTINAMSVVMETGAVKGLLTHAQMESKLTDTPLTVSTQSL